MPRRTTGLNMGGKGGAMTLFGRERTPRCIEPGMWPERRGRARVLIESPDAAVLWAHEEILREAGYDVAGCTGPTAGAADAGFQHRSFVLEGAEPATPTVRRLCPLVEGQRCALVEGADVIVSSAGLVDGERIIASHVAVGRAGVVVEATGGRGARDREGVETVGEPVTERRLLEAVARALAGRQA
jgi:hypothetical protein